MIKSVEYVNTAKSFKRIFKLNLNEFIDPLLTNQHEMGFDFEKFCEEMGKHYPEMDSDDVSLAEVIEAHYGQKGVKLIEKLI